LDYRKVLYEARREIRYVYFPIDGVASLVLEMGNSGVEVGTIGNEGMVGIPLALGDRQAPSTVYVQALQNTLSRVRFGNEACSCRARWRAYG